MNESRSLSRVEEVGSGGLAEAFDALTSRLQAGDKVSPEEVGRLYPGYAEELLRLLPALQALDNLSRPGDEPATDAALAGGHRTEPAPGYLGDYRIVREVGRGGMGVVYEAEQISL